ncbi:MAG: lipopolysaccharide heptosyltransferase II [Acidobacteriota bacterium]
MSEPTPATVARVVIRPPNWLGDAVMALPAMAALRLHWPAADLTIAAVPSVAALFREDTDVHPNHVIDLPTGTSAAVAALEGGGFDVGVLFPNSFRSAWQFWRAGIPARWGYARSGRRLLLTKCSARARRAGATHQVDYYRDLVAGLGIAEGTPSVPRLAPSHPSAERAHALLAQLGVQDDELLIGMAPGAAYGQAKQWSPDRMAEVAARLVRARHSRIVIVGASHDREAARAIESWLRAHTPDVIDRVINLAGRTSLGALVGVAARFSAFLSNDSGAMHLAAALGRPVVAIFGPTDERATRPLGPHRVINVPVFCRPCLLRDCPIDHRCMKRISADSVFSAVSQALDAGTAR